MKTNERRIESLERQIATHQGALRPVNLTSDDLEQCRHITQAYVQRFGKKYLHGDLLPEPENASPGEVAKVVVRNSCQVVKALILLRHWASIGHDCEPQDTWPQVLRNLETQSVWRT